MPLSLFITKTVEVMIITIPEQDENLTFVEEQQPADMIGRAMNYAEENLNEKSFSSFLQVLKERRADFRTKKVFYAFVQEEIEKYLGI